MKKQTMTELSRRRFLGTTAIGMAGLSIIPSLSSCTLSDTGDDQNIRLGFIGLGRQAIGTLLPGFMQIPRVRIVAGCDVYGRKRMRFENKVNEFYQENNVDVEVVTYEKYEDLLAREDIDAVVIATPDHAHAITASAALRAGKDVYLEKPMAFTIQESQELRKIVRDTDRILAVGSMQRSMNEFQHAVDIVKSGVLGKIEKVNAYVGAPPKPLDLREERIPEDLNWDLWLGPLPETIPYNSELNPPIFIVPEQNEQYWGGWRWYKETGGGYTTDWGAHMFDIAQWGLGMDGSGPTEVTPIGDGTEYVEFKYSNGVVMTSEPFSAEGERKRQGVKFWGENGWIEVSRGYFNASNEEWMLPEQPEQDRNALNPHHTNFIECVKNHTEPVVPVEIGCSSTIICLLGNIAFDLGRKIEWNPETETFINDPEATEKLHYPYRDGWSI